MKRGSGQLRGEEPAPPTAYWAGFVEVWPCRRGQAFAGNWAGSGFQQQITAILAERSKPGKSPEASFLGFTHCVEYLSSLQKSDTQREILEKAESGGRKKISLFLLTELGRTSKEGELRSVIGEWIIAPCKDSG